MIHWIFAMAIAFLTACAAIPQTRNMADRPAAQVSVPADVIPLVLGVQTHIGYHPPRTDAATFRSWMQRSGFTSARDEMFWNDVESAERLELQRGALNAHEVWKSMPRTFSGLLTLDFGHPGYDSGGQPKSEHARAAFARYAQFVVARGKPHVRWAEIWNEWNLKSGALPRGGSSGEAPDYVRLARTTYERLKAEDPDILVLAGSSGDDIPEWPWTPDWPWMREAIGHGLLLQTDGVAVHLYNHCMPARAVGSDELAARLDSIRGLVSAAGQPRMPIFVTEVGWPTHRGPCGIAETAAAAHSLRFLLEASVRPWVAGVWFYELQDSGNDPTNPEHRFGLLRRDGTEKPAGCLLRELGALVAARPFAFHGGNASGSAGFRNGEIDSWLLWTRGNAQKAVAISVQAASGDASAFASRAVCTMPAATVEADPLGGFVTIRLEPGGVQLLDVPAGALVFFREIG
jgi:hypothetical protein